MAYTYVHQQRGMHITMEITAIRQAAYTAACLAEDAWQDELDRVYGSESNRARYDQNLHAATPMLKALYEVRNSTTNAWTILGKIARDEIK